jgi:hypothetical protein
VVAVVSAARTTRGAAGEWRWSLLLPPNWITLPVEAAAGRAAVRRLLGTQLANLPRDRVAQARRRLESELTALLGEAREAGASTLYAHLGLIRGVPVSGTCAVSVVHGPVDDPRLVAELALAFGKGDEVVEVDVRQLAGLPAVRRRRRGGLAVEGSDREVPSTGLDWAVPLPDGGGALLLSFGTVTDPVADQLVALFDVIAGSLELTSDEG